MQVAISLWRVVPMRGGGGGGGRGCDLFFSDSIGGKEVIVRRARGPWCYI